VKQSIKINNDSKYPEKKLDQWSQLTKNAIAKRTKNSQQPTADIANSK